MFWNYWEFLIPGCVLNHSQKFQVFNFFLICLGFNNPDGIKLYFSNDDSWEFHGPWISNLEYLWI